MWQVIQEERERKKGSVERRVGVGVCVCVCVCGMQRQATADCACDTVGDFYYFLFMQAARVFLIKCRIMNSRGGGRERKTDWAGGRERAGERGWESESVCALKF